MPRVISPEARLSYVHVFKARLNKLNNKEEYSCVLLFPKGADISALKKAAEEAMIEKFGADKTKWPKNYNHPFKDQATADKGQGLPSGYEAGAIMINARSVDKPQVVKVVGKNQVAPVEDPADLYSGCWAKVSLSFYAYNHTSGQKGVNCSLGNICKTKDGDSLSGRPNAESEFAPVADGPAAVENAADLFDPMN